MTGGQARGRKPDEIPSEFVRIQGRRKRGISPRDDKTFAWLDGLERGKKFEFAWELITAAVNGELGSAMQAAVEVCDTDAAREAALAIKANFVDDD